MNDLTTNEDDLFHELEDAARNGLRAPTLDTFYQRHLKNVGAGLQELVAKGLITIEIYGKNWRVVTIMKGSCAGKRTLGPPHGGEPYIRLDKDGRHDLEDGEPIR